MKNYLIAASYATALLMITACATGIDTGDPAQMGQSALVSRSVALVGYDDGYVKRLTETIEKLRGNNQTSDQIILLFALDELADVYTYRRVDFEKALSLNREARSLLETSSCCFAEGQSLGAFFPRHRRAYAFVWHDAAETSKAESTPVRDIARLPNVKTIFPPDFLQVVENEDLHRLAGRIRERQVFLDNVLGNAAGIPKTFVAEGETTKTTEQEIEIWKRLFAGTLHARPYTQALLFHERIWALRQQLEEQKWLRMVAESSQKVIAAEVGYPKVRWRDLIEVRFHAGLANLRLGQTKEGVGRFEEMLRAVAEYDKILKAVNDRLLQEKQEKRKHAYITGAGALAIFSIASAVGGASGTQGAQRPLGEAMREMALGESNYRTVSSQLKLLFGQVASGVEGVLNEHERIAFHYELGHGYERLGRRKDAIAQYKSGIEIVERQRVTISSESTRIQFLKDKDSAYKRLIPLLIEEGDLEGAFEYMERARSRAFVDILAGSRLKLGTDTETHQYQTILRRQAEVEVLVTQEGLPRADAEQTHESRRGVAVQAGSHLGGSSGTPEQKIEQPQALVTPEFNSLTTVQTASVKEISRTVGNGAAILTFFVGDASTTVMLLQDGQIHGWVKPVGRAVLVQRIEALRRFLKIPDYPSPARTLVEIQRLGQDLYKNLLIDAIATVRKPVLYVVPHGPLHYLPLAAIYDGSQYLVDRFSLLTVPSGTVLTYLEKKPNPSNGQTIVFANPDLGNSRLDLPFAEQEAMAIKARRPQAVMLNRSSAMEARARGWGPKAGILHFAAHASFNEDRPLNSAILLTPGEGEDGALTAGEIFSFHLPGTLVVLSGCETGMGEVASGDELIGLTRAFMYAGAPQLIATLWPIDDEATSVLMENFYSQLSILPAASALREAQISVRHQYPHPFYWAAFTTYGHFR